MNKIVLALFSLLLVAVSGVAVYLYREVTILKADPDANAEKHVRELVEKVGKHIRLPVDEVPTIATVSDPDRLKDQPFFANAKAGDKALIYTGAKKAYLYDPVADHLIDVAPIKIGTDIAVPETQTAQ